VSTPNTSCFWDIINDLQGKKIKLESIKVDNKLIEPQKISEQLSLLFYTKRRKCQKNNGISNTDIKNMLEKVK